ncbi:MAG: DUF2167 domain-containing protein [Gemmatimonadales bacterium]
MLARWLAVLTFALVPGTIAAQDSAAAPADTAADRMTVEKFEASLGYQTGGTHSLKDGLATLTLPATFRFLGPEGSKRLLEDGWSNPKGSGDDVLGMLVPSGLSPMTDSGWAVVITYDEEGYIDDKGAEEIDYAKLLKDMQASTEEANKERAKDGYQPVTLVGWAEQPTYDRAAHKLYWAKELKFGTNAEHTLNYNVRVLGRRGVLVLNAVAGMTYLAPIKSSMREVITFVDFNEGHRYTDFIAGKDKVAAYGIAGLIAGAVATKAGLFKVILTALIAAKKFLVLGAAAAAAGARKMWAKWRGNDSAAA